MSSVPEQARRLRVEREDWRLPARVEPYHTRLDRNFAELLQELRVTLTGVQILFAFLLVLPFQARFAQTTPFERHLYTASLVATVVAACCLTAPVAFHRMVFRMNLKLALVQYAHQLVKVGLALLSVALVASMWLALMVANQGAPLVVAGLVGVVVLSLWWIAPLWVRFQHRSDPVVEEAPEGPPTSA